MREEPNSNRQKIMIREAKRNNTSTYREKAMECLGQFAIAFHHENLFPEFSEIISGVLENLEEAEEDMDIDAPNSGQPSGKLVYDIPSSSFFSLANDAISASQTRANAIRSLLQSLKSSNCSGKGKLFEVDHTQFVSR